MSINCQKWRLNNLYRIIDKDRNSIPFRMKPEQEEVLENIHNRNLILKARQLGMSTFAILYMLDETLFTENLTSGIVSYSLDHAQHIYQKIIGHALDTFPQEIKPYCKIIQQSARQISFNNGSSIRVDTTIRGGTCPFILVSEFGKTCARNPQKAEEVVTGTLQAVPKNGRVIIESTGEGNEGYFAEMVMEAHRRGDKSFTSLDYKLFFFPWMIEPTYVLDEPVEYPVSLTDYFNKLEKETGCTITQPQRNWYAVQFRVLGDKIGQEYPSTIDEAFLSSSDAYYWAEAIHEAYRENRCLYSPLYDALLPVYVSMDIGVNDLTVMIFFQLAHGEVRVIDYYEDKNKGVDFYAKFLLQDKKFLIHTIFLPHDSKKRDPLDTTNTYERDFRRLLSGTSVRVLPLDRMDKQLSIYHAKTMISRTVFNCSRVKKLLDNMSKYRKEWNEAQGRYIKEPLHNEASNYADAYRYLAQAVAHLEAAGNLMGAKAKHREVVESRYKRVI